MKKLLTIAVSCLFLLLMSVETVHAAQPFDQQFLGSPLLVLVVLVVAAAFFSVYHKMRK